MNSRQRRKAEVVAFNQYQIDREIERKKIVPSWFSYRNFRIAWPTDGWKKKVYW